MKIFIAKNPFQLGEMAAKKAAELIRSAISERRTANIIVGTGGSQIDMFSQLVREDIDWTKVVVFHLDEYIGLPESSPASFRHYLKKQFLDKIGTVRKAHLVNGDTNPEEECKRLKKIIENHPVDVALVGIGENGHLAFNDPPADFDTQEPYIVVQLDEKCRMQQVGEGWFKTFNEVPTTAISMSVQQICKSKHIICSVPDSRKAKAVRDCLEQPVSDLHPASVLQRHSSCYCYLDKASSALLTQSISSLEQLYAQHSALD